MSNRGSFVTQYVYCHKCFAALKAILLKEKDKYFCPVQVPTWNKTDKTDEIPIIAGKIGGMSDFDMEYMWGTELIPEIEKKICHEIRIAIMTEGSQAFLTVNPTHSLKSIP